MFLKSFQHYAFTASGKIVYVSRAQTKHSHPTNHDLFIFDTKTNTHHTITDNLAWDGNPIISPSHRYVAFLSQRRKGFESDQATLKVYDTKTSTVFSVTHNHDISLEEIAWSKDEKGLFFTTHHRGILALGYIALHGEKFTYLVRIGQFEEYQSAKNNVFLKPV